MPLAFLYSKKCNLIYKITFSKNYNFSESQWVFADEFVTAYRAIQMSNTDVNGNLLGISSRRRWARSTWRAAALSSLRRSRSLDPAHHCSSSYPQVSATSLSASRLHNTPVLPQSRLGPHVYQSRVISNKVCPFTKCDL